MRMFDENASVNLQEFKKYRKKTLIHAKQMNEEFCVVTKEGVMEGSKGDWLAVGVEKELYPIKASIFKKTYEEVKS